MARARCRNSEPWYRSTIREHAEQCALPIRFQLLHAPASLDTERSSWSTVVYFNVVKSIRAILEALDGTEEVPDPPEEGRRSDAGDAWRHQLANLKLRLSPLVVLEGGLASRLSGGGGVSMNGGKGGVLVRRGWQSSLKPSPATKAPRGHARGGKGSISGGFNSSEDPNVPIARMLDASKVRP